MNHPDELLRKAEEVFSILQRHHLDAIVIGAVALATHHYVRQTEDLDLGVNADLTTLRDVAVSLCLAGFDAELREPDDADPWRQTRLGTTPCPAAMCATDTRPPSSA